MAETAFKWHLGASMSELDSKGDSSSGPLEKNRFRMNWLEEGWFTQDPSWGEWQSETRIKWGGVGVGAGAWLWLWPEQRAGCGGR